MIFLFMVVLSPAYGDETSDIILKLLVKKGLVTQQEIDEMRDEIAKVKKTEAIEHGKAENIEKPKIAKGLFDSISISGDVRFRTRVDWGKPASNIAKQQVRESVRGRFGLEAKANDFITVGTRIIGGGGNPRSGDDTLNNYWSKATVYFDQYYIKFDPPKEAAEKFSKYLSGGKLWLGRFANPFETTEMVWDTDITPGGIAIQYLSPKFTWSNMPEINLYSNAGMLWVDESAGFNTDPILIAYQAGLKTEKFGALGSKLNIALTLYDFENIQHKTPNSNSAGTNSRVWLGDYNYAVSTGSPLMGSYKYEFCLLDLIVKVENEKFFDLALPHGFASDFVYNAGCHNDNMNKAVMAGGYLGKAKVKEPKDWKISAEWRYIERDSIPDFMPDANFYGFGTYTSANTIPHINGYGAAGGTNGKGIKTALEYQLFKNLTLSVMYYWMEPIKTSDRTDPWNEFVFDCTAKF